MNRQFRQLSNQTKQKISQSMVNRPKSDVHKANLSKSLKAYWEKIPNKPTPTDGASEENKQENN